LRSTPASERHFEPSDSIPEYNDGILNNSSSYQPHNYSYTEQDGKCRTSVNLLVVG
jgi:hypothetical protein